MRVDVGGTVRWATGETQQEVILAAAKILAESGAIKSEAKQPAQAPLFSECAWRWFDVYKLPKVKPNTAYNYRHDMENHILPVFGDRRIDEIKPSDIQAFLNTKKAKRLTFSAIPISRWRRRMWILRPCKASQATTTYQPP